MSRQAKKITEVFTGTTSRRGFLTRLGQLAGTAAVGVAGVLATRTVAAGGKEKRLCSYVCLPHLTSITKEVPIHRPCPKKWRGCVGY